MLDQMMYVQAMQREGVHKEEESYDEEEEEGQSSSSSSLS